MYIGSNGTSIKILASFLTDLQIDPKMHMEIQGT